MRYYVCDIIGDGTEANPYRPTIADHGDFSVAALPSMPDGSPATIWALAKSPVVVNVSGVRQIPILPPQAAQTAKDALNTILISMGITPDMSRPEYAGAIAMIYRDYN